MSGIGAFAGGLSKGLNDGMKMNAFIDASKRKKNIDAANKSLADKLKELTKQDQVTQPTQPINKSDFSGLSDLSIVGFNGKPVTMPNDDADVQINPIENGYAEGGLVEAGLNSVQPAMQPAMQQQIPQQPQQQMPPQTQGSPQDARQAQDPNKQYKVMKNLSTAYYAARDTALDMGDGELALAYMKKGFDIQDQLYKTTKTQAQNIFDTTGDIAPLIKVYNDAIPDGHDITGYDKTANGYMMKFTGPDGKPQQQEYTPDQVRQFITTMDDPSARWKAQMESESFKAKERFKTDENIRQENAKGYTLSQGQTKFDSKGNVIASVNKEPPQARSKTEYEIWHAENPNGRYEDFKKAGRKAEGEGGDATGEKELTANEQQQSVGINTARNMVRKAGKMKEIKTFISPKVIGDDGITVIDNPKYDARLAEAYKKSMEPDPQSVRKYGTDPSLDRYAKGLPDYKNTPLPPPKFRKAGEVYELPDGRTVKFDGQNLRAVPKAAKTTESKGKHNG